MTAKASHLNTRARSAGGVTQRREDAKRVAADVRRLELEEVRIAEFFNH